MSSVFSCFLIMFFPFFIHFFLVCLYAQGARAFAQRSPYAQGRNAPRETRRRPNATSPPKGTDSRRARKSAVNIPICSRRPAANTCLCTTEGRMCDFFLFLIIRD